MPVSRRCFGSGRHHRRDTHRRRLTQKGHLGSARLRAQTADIQAELEGQSSRSSRARETASGREPALALEQLSSTA